MAFQNGVECMVLQDCDDATQKIREGDIVTLESAFRLSDTISPVEVEIRGPRDQNEKPAVVAKVFNLNNLKYKE